MCNKNQAVETLSKVYDKCLDLFGKIESAYLYGSYARGDYSNESDVDILLTVPLEQSELSKHRMAIASISSDLSLDYDVTVSITVKSLKLFNQYCSILPFYQNVLREGIRYVG